MDAIKTTKGSNLLRIMVIFKIESKLIIMCINDDCILDCNLQMRTLHLN